MTTINNSIAVGLSTNTMPTTSAPPAHDVPDILPGSHDLMCSGDAGAMIAALAVEMGRSQKKAAMQQRRSAEATEESEQNQQIQALRDKADLVRAQGWVDGAMTLGEGALSFGSEMNGAAQLKYEGQGNKVDAGRVKGEGAWCQAGASVVKAGHEIADGLFKGAEADKDIDAQVHDQAATRAKRAVDDAMGDYEDAKKLLEKALDFYKEYTGAKNGAVAAAIHRA